MHLVILGKQQIPSRGSAFRFSDNPAHYTPLQFRKCLIEKKFKKNYLHILKVGII